METFRERLIFAMDNRELKQTDLVKLTGIKKSTISYYVTGRNLPNADNLRKISIALNVREDWLLGYDVPMERPAITSDQADEIIVRLRKLPPDKQQLALSLLQTLIDQDNSKNS